LSLVDDFLFKTCLIVGRLPDRLVVTFPYGDEIKTDDKKPAGSTIGVYRAMFLLAHLIVLEHVTEGRNRTVR